MQIYYTSTVWMVKLFPLWNEVCNKTSVEVQMKFTRTSNELRSKLKQTLLKVKTNLLEVRINFAQSLNEIHSKFERTFNELWEVSNELQMNFEIISTASKELGIILKKLRQHMGFHNWNAKPWLPRFQPPNSAILSICPQLLLAFNIWHRTRKKCKLFVNHLRWPTTNFEATLSELWVYFKQTLRLFRPNLMSFEATSNKLWDYFNRTSRLLCIHFTKFVGSMVMFFPSIPYMCAHICMKFCLCSISVAIPHEYLH